MTLFLTKILTALALPLAQSIAGMLIALALLRKYRRRGACLVLFASVAWLWIWSTPMLSNWITGGLERPYPPMSAARMPQADAILVLGGAVQAPQGRLIYPELGSAVDRVWHAARLYHAGRAPLIIASGGNLPWLGQSVTEAEAMRTVLADFGVPESAVALEDQSRNTHENMLRSQEMLQQLGLHTILLVTSALHMRRALAEATAVGIDAMPAPADYLARDRPYSVLDALPDAAALADSSRGLKEYLGCVALRGCD
jgi:uncharacterized SAM-binding protein YcdF (DUF218 family)